MRRLALVESIRQVIKNALRLLGIEAPERMMNKRKEPKEMEIGGEKGKGRRKRVKNSVRSILIRE